MKLLVTQPLCGCDHLSRFLVSLSLHFHQNQLRVFNQRKSIIIIWPAKKLILVAIGLGEMTEKLVTIVFLRTEDLKSILTLFTKHAVHFSLQLLNKIPLDLDDPCFVIEKVKPSIFISKAKISTIKTEKYRGEVVPDLGIPVCGPDYNA